MDFAQALEKRRMVRNYRSDAVPAESIERIIDAARKAPSAGFSQGVSFVVVSSEETRGQIADLAGEAGYVAAGFDPWISSAPIHIVVAVSERAYHERYQESDKVRSDGSEIDWPIPFWWVDAGASMMLALLAAVDEGMAAGFLGVHSIPSLRDLLQIPDHVTPIGIVTIGYPLADRRSTSLQRGWKARDQVVHYERWQPSGARGQATYPQVVTKSGAGVPANRGDV